MIPALPDKRDCGASRRHRFNRVMMLNSKYDWVKLNWTADDPAIKRVYSGLIRL
ncbi:hypothetical protein I4641_02615 [Waterburya agarophytonicola K14]|uniref:Uncharacterized protein n=1 Tax=Waterburya agarophytonicola KI4 TaxID=2874699 RepID=A0A964BM22_9CYAN|nr:hypothetical protein [Waterburya agarophytonicola]MCC0175875.1 hypothetical protein [Waterburya agarophytonicola KI4]